MKIGALLLIFIFLISCNGPSSNTKSTSNSTSGDFQDKEVTLQEVIKSDSIQIKDSNLIKKITLDSLNFSEYRIKQPSNTIIVNEKATLDKIIAYQDEALQRIREEQEKVPYKLGITSKSFAQLESMMGVRELTASEKKSIQKLFADQKVSSLTNRYLTIKGVTLDPTKKKLDLRDFGIIIPEAYDQGVDKPFCWAFSSAATYEINYQIWKGQKIEVSVQQIIDCSGAGDNKAGNATLVYKWMVGQNKNLDKKDKYSLYDVNMASKRVCTNQTPNTDFYAVDFKFVDMHDGTTVPSVQAIKEAICKFGAITSDVHMSGNWLNYTGGDVPFVDNRAYDATNHSVVIIGWDDSKGKAGAWLIRNSWGPIWGGDQRGYMWIEYGSALIGANAVWVIPKHQ